MRWTLKIGKLFGVNILIHWSFLLLIGWVVIAEYGRGSNTQTVLLTIAYVLVIFVCVILHEMGHILTARRYGIKTKKITLLPIGGIASIERIPENPRQELLIALAGPAVNIIIAAIIYPFLGNLQHYFALSSEETVAAAITVDNFWFSVFAINLLLVLFNLIPAFPMDGGRVLRALLSMRIGRLQATNVASTIGQFVAVLFFIVGLFFNPFLLLIGVFVFLGARGEHLMTQQTELLRGHLVAEAMNTHYQTFNPTMHIQDAHDYLVSTCDEMFSVSENGDFKGVITRKDILEALRENKHEQSVSYFVRNDLETLTPSDKLSKVLTKIRQDGQTAFPVVDNNQQFKGIISLDSIQRFLAMQSALSY